MSHKSPVPYHADIRFSPQNHRVLDRPYSSLKPHVHERRKSNEKTVFHICAKNDNDFSDLQHEESKYHRYLNYSHMNSGKSLLFHLIHNCNPYEN